MAIDFQSILNNGNFSDMTFVVNGKELRAHKAFIGAGSPVFAAMFSNECKESKENKVIISDVSIEVFKEMLQFIYTNKVKQMEKHAKELIIAADKVSKKIKYYFKK